MHKLLGLFVSLLSAVAMADTVTVTLPYVTAQPNSTVTLTAFASSSTGANIINFTWDLQDNGLFADFSEPASLTSTPGLFKSSVPFSVGYAPVGTTYAVCSRADDGLNRGTGCGVVTVQDAQAFPPTSVIAPSGPIAVNTPFTFDGSGSFDADGDPLTFKWDFTGDGLFKDATGINPTWTFSSTGTYDVGLLVTDHPELSPRPYNAPDLSSTTRMQVDVVSAASQVPEPNSLLLLGTGLLGGIGAMRRRFARSIKL